MTLFSPQIRSVNAKISLIAKGEKHKKVTCTLCNTGEIKIKRSKDNLKSTNSDYRLYRS